MKGITYARIKAHVGEGGSVSGFLETLLLAKLGPPDDEDRRKFGEAHAKRQKGSEAEKAKESDEPQIQDEPEPEPQFTTAPEEAVVTKVVESVNIPEELLQDAGPGVPQPEPKPEPKPELRPPTKRRLSNGSPAENLKPADEDVSGLEDYVPPIRFF